MIKLKSVSKIYYNKGVIGTGFSKVSLEFNIGEFIAITGESGSGKSTLLNVISGLDTYEEGEMYINGEETSHYSEEDFEEYRRKYVANIFQGFNLVNSYTVRQNVELVLLIHGFSKKVTDEKVDKIIKDVGLWEYRNKKVSKLSGGQKQRVAIARALAKETPIIVADEPTGNLDKESSKQIIKLLHEISKNKLVIIVTHNFETVEDYVTRVIRMHDGKVVEDKKVKEYKTVEVSSTEIGHMSFASKVRISLRNTFNIFFKFLLILGVFVMCVCGILTNIGGQIKGKHDSLNQGISSIFVNQDPNRIIIRHKDKSIITDEEYDKIAHIKNVKKIEKNDLKLDSLVSLYREESDVYLDVTLKNIEDFDLEIAQGRMPSKENEVVLVAWKDDFFIDFFAKDFLDKEINPVDDNMNSYSPAIKIVGIAEIDDFNMNYDIYGSTKIISELEKINTFKYGNATVYLNDKDFEGLLALNDAVKPGEVYISDTLTSECKNGVCLNSDISVEIKNIYTSRREDFKITQVLDKKNIEKLINEQVYENVEGKIFMNTDDFNRLNDTNNYQSSVFVNDVDNMDSVIKELEKLDLQVLPIKDSVDFDASDLAKLVDFFNVIGSVFVLVVLYFISYFVIFLVLKSRNTYFAVVRILGGTVSICRELLNIELFVSSTIAFIVVTIFGYLFKYNLISFDLLSGYMTYLKWYHFVLSYLIIIVLSQLIARRFSKKIFKDSMITTYNMEV